MDHGRRGRAGIESSLFQASKRRVIVSRHIRLISALVVCLACAAGARAQQAERATDRSRGVILGPDEPVVPAKAGKILHAFRVTASTTPKIDGTLDDEVWGRAQSVGDYVQWDPDNGQPASERTLLQVAYDDQFLYVAIRC